MAIKIGCRNNLEHSKPEDRGNEGNLKLQSMMESAIQAMAASGTGSADC